MPGYSLKRAFAGKFVVMTDDEEQVFGPDSKAACEGFIAAKDPPAAADKPKLTLQAWDRKLTEDMKRPLSDEEAEIKAILAKRRSGDEVEFLLRQIKPLLVAGLQGGRRERLRFVRPAVKAA